MDLSPLEVFKTMFTLLGMLAFETQSRYCFIPGPMSGGGIATFSLIGIIEYWLLWLVAGGDTGLILNIFFDY